MYSARGLHFGKHQGNRGDVSSHDGKPVLGQGMDLSISSGHNYFGATCRDVSDFLPHSLFHCSPHPYLGIDGHGWFSDSWENCREEI
jgi:hypothetical protein